MLLMRRPRAAAVKALVVLPVLKSVEGVMGTDVETSA